MPADAITRDPAERLGATIKALREAYGLKLTELAALTGVTRRYLSYIEGGTRPAGTVLCRKIADALGVPLAAITVEGYEDVRDARRSSQDGDAA